MVEVDVFWAYGIGASCAAAAGAPLARVRKSEHREHPNRAIVNTRAAAS